MKRKMKVMKEAEVGFNGAERQELEKDWKMLAGSLKGKNPKGQKEWDAAQEWFAKNGKKADESSEVECDGCGRIVHDDDVEIVGDQVLCYNCRSKYYRKPGYWQESKKKKNWMGVPHSQFLYHGDWSDPEVYYKGFYFNYWDVIEGPLLDYREEHPEDKNEDGFDKWFEEKGADYIENELYNMVYGYVGEDWGDEWLGIPEAYLLLTPNQEEEYVFYDGWKIELSDVQDECGFYDEDEEFSEFLERAKGDRKLQMKVKAALDKCKSQGELYCEGLQEDVLEMPDRVDELEAEIEKLWVRLGDVDEDTVQKLIADYVELDKIEPGRVDFLKECKMVNEETREEIAYLKSIGEYDDYKKMVRALKAKNAKKKATKKPAKRKFGGASKKSTRKPISRPAAKKEYKYSFSASGYGTKTYSFSSEEECLKEMKQDAEATAEDYGGEVQWWDDKECVVIDGDGQELGTFVYLGARR